MCTMNNGIHVHVVHRHVYVQISCDLIGILTTLIHFTFSLASSSSPLFLSLLSSLQEEWRGLKIGALHQRIRRLTLLLDLSEPGTIPEPSLLSSLFNVVSVIKSNSYWWPFQIGQSSNILLVFKFCMCTYYEMRGPFKCPLHMYMYKIIFIN